MREVRCKEVKMGICHCYSRLVSYSPRHSVQTSLMNLMSAVERQELGTLLSLVQMEEDLDLRLVTCVEKSALLLLGLASFCPVHQSRCTV